MIDEKQAMNIKKLIPFLPLLFMTIAGIVILIVWLATKNSINSSKQGWARSFATPATSPISYTTQGNWNNAYRGDKATANALIAKWYNFADAVGPQVASAIYNLFPNIQPREALALYGIPNGMIDNLKTISSKLDSPQSVKTLNDVNALFLPDALNSYNRTLGVKPQDGLYNNVKEYGEFIDVV